MRIPAYLVIAVVLPFCGRFQEVAVKSAGEEQFRGAVYSQIPVCILFGAISLFCFIGLALRLRKATTSLWVALPIRYGWFALPALFYSFGWSQFGTESKRFEVQSGIGGPYAGLLALTAAITFVAVEAYLRIATEPSKAPAAVVGNT